MDVFSKFHPLFMEAINNNRIGVCKWNEAGTTLDTAVPELGALTNDKEEWKAVIVRYEDDRSMSCFESDARNPYDFFVNHNVEGGVEESEIPLIRLTQMLGGVPAPEMKFVCEQINEEHKAPRVVYRPLVDREEEERYKRLCKKYEFDGKLPASIMIISVRGHWDEGSGSWTSHKESDSSEFWKRNRYPSICRFMVYDFEKQGPTQKSADEFGFWLSTLLVSLNEIDSSTLQAYRLYTLKTKIDKLTMSECFQAIADRLKTAKHILEKEIKKEIEEQLTLENDPPDYQLEISVPIKLPNNEECSVNSNKFGLFSEGPNSDTNIWFSSRKEVEARFQHSVKVAERTLDQTVEKMRDNCVFSEDEVMSLDRYQREDLIDEIGGIYDDIVRIQGELPMDEISSDVRMSLAADKVRKYLRGRVTGSSATTAVGIVFGLLLISQITAFVQFVKTSTGSIGHVLAIVGVEFCVVLLFAAVVLGSQKSTLNGLLREYNTYLKAGFLRLTENAGDYSRYLSDIASYSRGCSYLNLSSRIKHKSEDKHYAKRKHIKAINMLLSRLKVWSKAYCLNVDFEKGEVEESVKLDITLTPARNPMYSMGAGKAYPVMVNNSGILVDSPFCFTKKIEIVREELYDGDECI